MNTIKKGGMSNINLHEPALKTVTNLFTPNGTHAKPAMCSGGEDLNNVFYMFDCIDVCIGLLIPLTEARCWFFIQFMSICMYIPDEWTPLVAWVGPSRCVIDANTIYIATKSNLIGARKAAAAALEIEVL